MNESYFPFTVVLYNPYSKSYIISRAKKKSFHNLNKLLVPVSRARSGRQPFEPIRHALLCFLIDGGICLQVVTEMTKMIKRVLVFLKFIFGEEVACWDVWTWISGKIRALDGACGSVWESMNKRRDLYIVAGW